MPATEKQIAANRANARKSTGPRTEQGKARSRANSLKHGMAGAGIVLPEEDRERWEFRAETWAEEMGAVTDMDRFLAGRAAMASVRLDRCVREETASLVDVRARALARWQAEREARAQVEAHAQILPTDPAAALRGLTRTVLGCAWLIARWEGLAATLQDRGAWGTSDLRLAAHLLGGAGIPDRPALWRANAARFAARGELGGAEGEMLAGALGVAPLPADPEARRALILSLLPGAEAALEELRAHCEAELGRLESIRDALWDAVDGPARQGALDLVAVDVSGPGMLRRRYETAATSELHRSINQVHKNRREAAACETKPIAGTSGVAGSPGGSGAGQAHEDVSLAPSAREAEPIPAVRNEPIHATEVVAIAAVSPAAVGAAPRVEAPSEAAASVVRNEANPPASPLGSARGPSGFAKVA